MLKLIKSKLSIHTLITGLLTLSVAILTSMVFYLSIPHLYFKRMIYHPIEISKKIVTNTSVDISIVWDLDLDMNNRKALGFSAKNDQDTMLVTDYLNSVKDIKITSTLGASEIYALMTGQYTCSVNPIMNAKISPDIKKFFETNPNSFTCLIPIEDSIGAIIGQISIIWKEKPSQEHIISTLGQIKGILKS